MKVNFDMISLWLLFFFLSFFIIYTFMFLFDDIDDD